MNQENSQHNKIVLFPGMMERWIEEATIAAENYQYHDAIKTFEKILQYTIGDEHLLSVYLHCLYETKNFSEAKEICEDILALNPVHYFEVMELYLTICMQLKEFKQVDKLIQTLMDEDVIPHNQIEKFQRIQNLNVEIEQNKQMLEDQEMTVQDLNEVDFDEVQFLQLSDTEKLIKIQELSALNIRPFAHTFKLIIETEEVNPFIKSMLLILLVEQEVSVQLFVQKLEQEASVNPTNLKLPTKLPQFERVEQMILNKFEQDPTSLELAHHIITKHAIVSYPFEWHPFEDEDVAFTYIHYIEMMFGKIQEHDYEIMEYIQTLEKLSALQNI